MAVYYKGREINEIDYVKVEQGGSSGDVTLADGTKFAYSTWTELPSYVKPYLETQSDWGNMFNDSKLTGTIDLTDINTNNTLNMRSTFGACYDLNYVNISNVKVSTLSCLFSVANSLLEVNLTNIDISDITSIDMMFTFCNDLEKINVSGWIYPSSMSQIKYYSNLFNECSSLTSLILGNVTQEQYDWWYARLVDEGIQDNVTITYNIIT